MEITNKIPGENENEIEPQESDSQKIIHRHLENEDDIITDEDIKNVRVGVLPADPDKATLERFEGEERPENEEKKPLTPWDTVEEE